MRRVYLDNTASTPVLPEVLEAMLPYLKETYGNPQSIHDWGDPAREAIDDARGKVADLIGGKPRRSSSPPAALSPTTWLSRVWPWLSNREASTSSYRRSSTSP